jgi:hypothetical protein
MINEENFREFALSFENVEEKPHFEATSFRINGKIFASLEIEKLKACLKFSLENQNYFTNIDKAIYPVDNYWGKSGWTYVEIKNIREELLIEALENAYKEVSKSKMKTKK